MAEGQQFEERWQDGIASIRQALVHIYETKEFYDVNVLVKGEFIKAHKLVLAARSSKFVKLLLSNEVDTIAIDDTITPDGFEILLKFIYTDRMETTDKQKIIEAYNAALFYNVEALQDRCIAAMESWKITIENVCQLFELGINVPTLNNRWLEFMTNNGQEVINSPSFLEISLGGLYCMLKCGALAQIPVLQRIQTVIKWFNKHNSAIDNSEIRHVLQTCCDVPLLGTLNFELLSLDELSIVSDEYEGLITAEENQQFMKYHRRSDPSKLPEWCILPAKQ